MAEAKEAKQLIEATKHTTDANTAMAKSNFDAASVSFKKAAEWYGEAAKATTEDKARDALLLLKASYEQSADIAMERKQLLPFKLSLAKVRAEHEKTPEVLSMPKVDDKEEKVGFPTF